MHVKSLVLVLISGIALALAGCWSGPDTGAAAGGGGTPPAMVGVAAAGAPIAGGKVVRICGDGSTQTTTTDANGAYALGLTNCAAPYVVAVTGNIGDAQETLVSLLATESAGLHTVTINVTPLTHAVAATIASSGDPLDLLAKFTTERANITDAAVKQRKNALVAALANTLAAAGIDATKFDLVTSTFTADRTGLDKVLDNLKVQVTTTGVTVINTGAVKVDDMGDNPPGVAADLSAASISFSKNTNFSAGLPKLAAPVSDTSFADSIRDALNACFAQTQAARGTFGALSAQCRAIPIASDYLHDGKNGSQEFDRFFGDARYDNARFDRPGIIRFFSNSTSDTRALVMFTLTRLDGVVESFVTVEEQSSANTGGVKTLRGNQRPFKVAMNAFVAKVVEIENKNAANPKATFYTTGVNLQVGFNEGGAGGSAPGPTSTGRKVAYAKVTGPGLPVGGVFLNPLLSGCGAFYAIATSSAATPGACTSLFHMSSRAATTRDADNAAVNFGLAGQPAFAPTKLNDAQILAIKPFAAYKFEIFLLGNTGTTPDHVFYERLRSRPYTMGDATLQSGEVDKVRWNTLSAETIDLIDPLSGRAFAGGNPSVFPVNWTDEANALPIHAVQVQSQPGGTAGPLFSDQVLVPFSANSATLSNGSLGWPDMGATRGITPGAFNLVEISARNRFDAQLLQDWMF